MKGYKHKRTLTQPDEFKDIKKHRLEETGIIDTLENKEYEEYKKEIEKKVKIHNLIDSLRFSKNDREWTLRICKQILRLDTYNEIALKTKEKYR